MRPFLPTVLLAACTPDGPSYPVDADLDGAAATIDCDDADPSIGPGALETMGDGVDSDCDGRDLAGWVALGPATAGPRFDQVNALVLLATSSVPSAGDGRYVYQTFDARTLARVREVDATFEDGGTDPMGPAIDLVALPSGRAAVATSWDFGDGTGHVSLAQHLGHGWRISGYPFGEPGQFDDVATAFDGQNVFIVACGPGLAWTGGTLDGYAEGQFAGMWLSDDAGTRCDTDGVAVGVLRDGAIFETALPTETVLDPNTIMVVTLVDALGLDDVSDFAWEPEGRVVAQPSAITLLLDDVLAIVPESPPERVRLDIAPDGWVYVVYADAAGDLYLIEGPRQGPFEQQQVGAGVAADDLDVEASETSLFLGGRSGDEVVYARMLRP